MRHPTYQYEDDLMIDPDNGREVPFVVEFGRSPSRPATYWDPPEGGELEDVEVYVKLGPTPLPDMDWVKLRSLDELNRIDEDYAITEDDLHDHADRHDDSMWG